MKMLLYTEPVFQTIHQIDIISVLFFLSRFHIPPQMDSSVQPLSFNNTAGPAVSPTDTDVLAQAMIHVQSPGNLKDTDEVDEPVELMTFQWRPPPSCEDEDTTCPETEVGTRTGVRSWTYSLKVTNLKMLFNVVT